jgi:DNA-binding Lrp family transcriptional regulator
MTQAERDRLVALKKAKRKLITQKEAAEEIGITERQVRRLLRKLRRLGDKAVIHALRGKPSNCRLTAATREQAVKVLRDPVYQGFGPTLAAEYLRKRHKLTVSKETLRKWMVEAGLWKSRPRRIEEIHIWRARRSCWGDLVQWDTSEHDWLEGRGEKIYVIAMIDDATSRWFARFVRSDSSPENMKVLREYLVRFGRPLAFYTDKASLFQTAVKTKRGERRGEKDQAEMPPTQIARALRELNIVWIPAHSPQAKGRVERGFGTAQDRLVKGLRVAGASTLEEANAYLDAEFLPWWNRTLAVVPASSTDAHRPLGKEHDLAAILSHVEEREVANDYTVRYDAKIYQIDRKDVRPGMRGAKVRVELRLDGSIAIRFRDRYVSVKQCEPAPKVAATKKSASPRRPASRRRGSDWNKNFNLHKAPKIWQVAESSGTRTEPLP